MMAATDSGNTLLHSSLSCLPRHSPDGYNCLPVCVDHGATKTEIRGAIRRRFGLPRKQVRDPTQIERLYLMIG